MTRASKPLGPPAASSPSAATPAVEAACADARHGVHSADVVLNIGVPSMVRLRPPLSGRSPAVPDGAATSSRRPVRCQLSRRNQTCVSRDYPTVAPAHNGVNFSHSRHYPSARHSPDTIRPFQMAVPPITSRTVQPSIVVGLVSATAMGLVQRFARSLVVGPKVIVSASSAKKLHLWFGRGPLTPHAHDQLCLRWKWGCSSGLAFPADPISECRTWPLYQNRPRSRRVHLFEGRRSRMKAEKIRG